MLQNHDFLFRYGYYFFAYDKENIFYELFYIFRKILLVSIEIFFVRAFSLSNDYNPETIIIMMFTIFSGFYVANKFKIPYDNEKYPILNNIESKFLKMQAIMCWLGSISFSLTYLEENLLHRVITLAILFILGASNAYLLITWVACYWKFSAKSKLNNLYRKVKKKLTNVKRSKFLSIFGAYNKRNSILVSIDQKIKPMIKNLQAHQNAARNISSIEDEISNTNVEMTKKRIEELELLITTFKLEIDDLKKNLELQLPIDEKEKNLPKKILVERFLRGSRNSIEEEGYLPQVSTYRLPKAAMRTEIKLDSSHISLDNKFEFFFYIFNNIS